MSLLARSVVCCLVLLLATGAAAQSPPAAHTLADAAGCLAALEGPAAANATSHSCVVAYAHVDSWAFGLLNTERPPDTLPPVEIGPRQPSLTPYWDLTHYRFDLQAGPVEYRDGSIHSGFHGGFKRPLLIDEGIPLHARFHLTIDQAASPATAEAPASAGILPCITVDVRVAAGDRTGPQETLSEKTVVGHLVRPGTATPTLPCTDDDSFQIDAAGITTFDVTLPPVARSIDADDHLFWELAVHNAEHEETRASAHGIRLVQDPAHLNMLVLPVHDPIRIDTLRPAWHEDLLYVRANITSPFGDYDVDRDGLDLRILGPDGAEVASRGAGTIPEPTIRHAVFHDDPEVPVQATFAYDVRDAELPDGRYTLQLVAQNTQRLASTVAEAAFTVSGDGGRLTLTDPEGVETRHDLNAAEETPVHLLAFLLTLLALVALRRHGTT